MELGFGNQDDSVNGATHVFWSMVWIDDAGIKFNQSKAWDGNETGFSGINSINGDLAGNIKDNGDNIATDTPGWYLMVITSSVSGRNLVYDIQFNKPEIWLMGPVVGNSDWKEQAEGWLCTIPDTFNASLSHLLLLPVSRVAMVTVCVHT